jgi:protein-S-isoprenylcysteine O-methyltransferase Ste14
MVAGLSFCLMGITKLGWNDTLGSKVSGLRQTGLYRYSRNPQLAFYFVFYIGYALLWPSLAGLIWLGVYRIISHIMVLTEEEHLFRVFGEEYQQYHEKTPRYIFSLTKRI